MEPEKDCDQIRFLFNAGFVVSMALCRYLRGNEMALSKKRPEDKLMEGQQLLQCLC
jgi:hypothetical protein